jgi:peroxiredoxin
MLALLPALPLMAHARIVRPASSFTLTGAGGARSLAGLRGQPVVLLVAKSAKTGPLRKQLKNLRPVFHECASRGTVFAAAMAASGEAMPSNIPFQQVANAQAVATAYGLKGDFLIAIIGRDGNLDLLTEKVQPGKRVLEVINNSFAVQEENRRDIPKGPPAR